MPILHDNLLQEYLGTLRLLKEEDDELEESTKEMTKRRDEINKRIKEIALIVGGNDKRVILKAAPFGAWDRGVTPKGEGIDISKLEEELGTLKFRRLCCIKEIVWKPDEDMIGVARKTGKLTDEVYNKAFTKGTPSYTLRKMTQEQFEKSKEPVIE